MKIYLKIVLGDWRNASRDRRELRVARGLGYEPLVIASSHAGKDVYRDLVEDFNVIRIPTRKYGDGKIRKCLGYIHGFRTFVSEAQKVDAAVMSGHNYSGFMIGYLSQRHKKIKAKTIYDSHEFELQQSNNRSKLALFVVKKIEAFVLNRADINMMVTDSIADEVQKIYSLKKRPLVVRNIPAMSVVHEEIVVKNRREFLDNLNIPEDGFIIMHHGGLAPGRGIEEAIKATAKLSDVGMVVMGYALDSSYKRSLENLVSELGINDRVYFKDAVQFSELYDYVAAVDAGIVLIQNVCASFLYSLPNKLFENIQAMTPVIGSDFPEIGGLVDRYGVGIKIDPADVDALVNAVNELRTNNALYQQIKENEKKAREELCWEVEQLKLADAIERI